MNKDLVKLIEAKFIEKLQEKTNWGRNDVMKAFKEALNQALLEMLDKEENKNRNQ